MRKPSHKHVKDLAGLARLRRPLAGWVHCSQGHSFDARVIPASVAGAELAPSSGCDLPARERSSDTLQALISTLSMGGMPCASVPA